MSSLRSFLNFDAQLNPLSSLSTYTPITQRVDDPLEMFHGAFRSHLTAFPPQYGTANTALTERLKSVPFGKTQTTFWRAL